MDRFFQLQQLQFTLSPSHFEAQKDDVQNVHRLSRESVREDKKTSFKNSFTKGIRQNTFLIGS